MMDTLEISLQRKTEQAWPVVANLTSSGKSLPIRRESMMKLEPESLHGMEFDALKYGTVLGKALFVDEIRDTFAQAIIRGDRLRILLTIEAPELRILDWHRLTAPINGQWRFLAVQQNTHFSLDIPSPASSHFPVIGRRDLRALILVAGIDSLSGDYNLAPFDVTSTIESIQAALCDIPSDVLAQPSLDALAAKLTAEPYTILHMVCHGALTNNGETILYLPKDDTGRPITGTTLIDRLASVKNLPHFAFLSTCESADPRAENGMGSLAHRLVRELGLPAIVAMTDRISIDTAQAIALPFYTQLYSHGEPDRALAESLAGLQERPDLTVPALLSRLAGRPLFSDTLEREITDKEIGFGLTRLSEILPERAPVLLPGLVSLEKQVRSTMGADLSALSDTSRRERAETLAALNNLCIETIDLTFNALCLGQEPPPYDSRSPFRGLESFRPEDKEFFFGREQLTNQLVKKINEHPFLAVLGASGSGKSSLVMAGVIPSLGREYAYLKPGLNPVTALVETLETAKHDAILVVDQFEELFTLNQEEQLRLEFVKQLLKQLDVRQVIITMRADFLGEVSRYASLREQVQNHQEIIPPMNAAELRRSMEGQARQVGLRFEADLSQQMLDDVASEPGAMPLLQHALWMLWKQRHGRWLRSEEYRAFGGVRQAIASTAEEVYAKCSPAQQNRIQDIFLRLTRLGESNSNGEFRDTRRRILMNDLIPVSGDTTDTVLLTDKLANARLIVKSLKSGGQETATLADIEVEVAHEALIRHWERLKSWLNEDRDNLRLREGVSDDARRWENGGRDENLLNHRAARLELALAISQHPRYLLNPVEQAYLDACTALAEREKAAIARRRRLAITGISIALLIIIAILAAWGWSSQQNSQILAFQVATSEAAEATAIANELAAKAAQSTAMANEQLAIEAQSEAQHQAFTARVGELTARAVSMRPKNPVLSLLLGVEVFRMMDTPRTRFSLLDNFMVYPQVHQYLNGHTQPVTSLTFNPDGKILASGSYDNSIIFWDMESRQALGPPLREHEGVVQSLVFSPDGKLLASGGDDRRLIVWDVETRQPVREIPTGHGSTIRGLAFSPDGNLLATASFDHKIMLWDVNSQDRIGELIGHSDGVYSVAFNPEGLLASASMDQTILLWDIQTMQPIGDPLTGHIDTVTSVTFSPNGQTLASGSVDKTIILWDVQSRQPIGQPLRGHSNTVRNITFSKNGSLLASAGYDNQVILWDPGTGQPLGNPFTGHTDMVRSVAFSPDETYLVSGSDDTRIILWNLEERIPVAQSLQAHTGQVNSVAYSPSGKLFASGSSDNTVVLWDAETNLPIKTLTGHQAGVLGVAFSPDGKILASASIDRTINLWDLDSFLLSYQLPARHLSSVASLAFSPDGKILASGSVDRTILFWDLNTREPMHPPLEGHSDNVWSLAFSSDGRLLASGSYDNTVILWDVASRQKIGTLNGHTDRVSSVVFGQGNKVLASSSYDGTVILWDVETQERIDLPLSGHTNRVFSVIFSPDGSTLASGSADDSILLWDAQSRQPIGEPLRGSKGDITSLSFSANGNSLVSGSLDHSVIAWDLVPLSWLEEACTRTGRNFTGAEWELYFPGEPYRVTCQQWPANP
jgi:WD40 repeat protein/energy-coupling factor transporter ATP-binding protein EcfA2